MQRPALLSLLLAGALAGPALAMDPRMPLLSEDQGPAAKVERFRKAYAEDPRALAGLDGAAPTRDRIHRALLAAVPAYAQAYAEYERLGDNADAWQAVAASSDDLYLKSHATYFLGRSLLAQDDLAGAAEALEAVRGRLRVGTPYADEATFYLGYVYARLPELGEYDAQGAKARAQQLLGELISRDVPERVSEGAHWLLRELRGEGMGPLLELAKRMETIERLIRRTRTGKGTQKRQEQVVAQIDKLIELMREKEKKGGGSCDKPGQKKKPGQCDKPGTPKGPPKQGAKKSTLPGGDGKEGELHEASRAADQDGWASMKKKEREKVEQFLKQRFPTRYRELIEKYFRGVAEADK
ncbi:MAG TPA: hypothetical protein DEA08_38545 [Planctomycetes bacterium]|nr:hypothetical protein [Planctomycetota bacterium]